MRTMRRPRSSSEARSPAACEWIRRLELRLARGVDGRLHGHVVPRPGLREELVERAARLDVGLAALEHLVRLVLRRLHVRLVERVDPEDRAGDSRPEVP